MIDYNFYLETKDNKTFVRTPGVDFQAPVTLSEQVGRFQVWHKPSRTVWVSRGMKDTDPAYFVVIGTTIMSASEREGRLPGKDWMRGKQEGKEFLGGHKWRAARESARAEARRLNRLEHEAGHAHTVLCPLCTEADWKRLLVNLSKGNKNEQA